MAMLWIDKEGNEWNIRNMTDNHIRNSINWLKSEIDYKERRFCGYSIPFWLIELEHELKKRNAPSGGPGSDATNVR